MNYYQQFKWQTSAVLPIQEWKITENDIRPTLDSFNS